MPAILKPDLVRRAVDSFPSAGEWQQITCAGLRAATISNPDARNWSPLTATGSKGGVYAFIFPKHFFADPRTIRLDGPGQRHIPFQFAAMPEHLADQAGFVVYIGRAANLLQRFHWHFSLTERNTGAQVQYGLVKCGICQNRKDADSFMLDHARIAYHIVHGDDQAANRDIIELSLCGKFMSPFNIKSEH
jgi:hypothetical protein